MMNWYIQKYSHFDMHFDIWETEYEVRHSWSSPYNMYTQFVLLHKCLKVQSRINVFFG